jgi:tRNA1Val (adenine37-N6)-methyltransferase
MKVTTDACLFGAWVVNCSPQDPVENSLKVLDVGTGTGLLSLMHAQKNSNVIIDAIEIDEDAAQQAKENVDASPWAERITVINADVRMIVPTLPQYDIIISNPPFHENQLVSADAGKNKAYHSSELTLEELLKIISALITPDGHFYILLPYYRLEEARNLMIKMRLGIQTLVKVKQSPDHDFFRIMIEGKSHINAADHSERELCIWDEKQEYSPDFTNLLKDFYLYL